MTLFRNKYRAESTRLPGWNYASDGYYFVTICTKNRIEWFGEIKNGIMGLNEMGCIAAKCWQQIPKHFPHVTLDAWVIMPDHVHGIVIINNHNANGNQTNSDHNPKIWHPSFEGSKSVSKNMPPQTIFHSSGNPYFMIESSEIQKN